MEVREGPPRVCVFFQYQRRTQFVRRDVRGIYLATSTVVLIAFISGCGSGQTARSVASPSPLFSIGEGSPTTSPTAGDSSPSPTTPTSTPSAGSCPRIEPLPGLCIGRAATKQEEAAMIAAGGPAIEKDYGWKDWSVCSNGQQCFKVGNPSRAMVGTHAGTFYGSNGQFPGGGFGSGCWLFLYQDSRGWHYVDAACAQSAGYGPGIEDRVFVSGCANVRAAPAL